MIVSEKVALVTGGSRGIGKSIAIELAKKGYHVIINFNKDESGADETLKLINRDGGKASIYRCDISQFSMVGKMIEDIVKLFGNIDILVNNAGISKIGLFMDASEKDWDDIINVNLKGVFNCCRAVINPMIMAERGSIINISSIWGNVGASCEVIYSASKGGINSFTKALAKEIASSGIRVNAISPGVIETDMNKFLSPEEKKDLLQEIPMGKLGKAEDIAKLVVFLSSENSNYITGQVITVDGGML